jgi:hypothetical protein
MANENSKDPEALTPDDPYWFSTAMLRVRDRHAEAGTKPATFGDLVREAAEDMMKHKAKAGIKPRSI